MEARLDASVEASALMRRAAAEGGFATIIAKGDAQRGALVLIITQRGQHVAMLERMLNSQGRYDWQASGPATESDASARDEWLKKRRRNDSDLWLIELDVPDAERFIAETTLKG